MRYPLTLLLGLLLACSHAETVATPATPSPPDAPTRLPSARTLTPPSEPGHPPLAASPAQLMAPDSADAIADTLRKRGLLSSDAGSKDLEAALRRFQDSQGLAATGFPDHETLRKLGIDPRAVDTTAAKPDAGK